MKGFDSHPIVLGSIELVCSTPRRKKVLTATVKEVVFLNCDKSKDCPRLLRRAIKRLPANYRKLEGWAIAALNPEKHLGHSIPAKSEIIGE